ncbi:MAG: NUDIX hydrolase [Chloroflexi bacterium]|nr:NUDIX hydrolase [Chloroflexota bacterium]
MTTTASPSPFQTLRRRVVYRVRSLCVRSDLVRLPDGREREFAVIDVPGCAVVVPVDEQGQVLLIRQHRYATGEETLEVPAGGIDPGETPEQCARRELEEETGYRAGRLEPLGQFYTSDGLSNELAHLFLARQLTPGQPNLQAGEVIRLEWHSLAEAIAQVCKGGVRCGPTALALLLAHVHLGGQGEGKELLASG